MGEREQLILRKGWNRRPWQRASICVWGLLLFLLPGAFARESVLHVLAEMFDWFDRYVKNPQQ